MPAEPGQPGEEHFRPPLGSWGRIYALVLAALSLEVLLLWLLSRAFP
ncbi:MAG TPA: hypothetical protein VMT17_14135 [Anaeromyxobacteraceae bacterium]|nr:hypothetical protein [Anaeromyxobacteraceae bacterium]